MSPEHDEKPQSPAAETADGRTSSDPYGSLLPPLTAEPQSGGAATAVARAPEPAVISELPTDDTSDEAPTASGTEVSSPRGRRWRCGHPCSAAEPAETAESAETTETMDQLLDQFSTPEAGSGGG